jgi:hypothetical protein
MSKFEQLTCCAFAWSISTNVAGATQVANFAKAASVRLRSNSVSHSVGFALSGLRFFDIVAS